MSTPPSFASVFGKNPADWIEFLVSGSMRSLQSLILNIRNDMQRHFPQLSEAVIDRVSASQEFDRIRHEALIDAGARSKAFGEMLESRVFLLPEQAALELLHPPKPRKAMEADPELAVLLQQLATERVKNQALTGETRRLEATLKKLTELQALQKEKKAIERQIDTRNRELSQFEGVLKGNSL